MPGWNEGGYDAGLYDAGPILDTGTPPPLPLPGGIPPPDPSGGVAVTTAQAIRKYWNSSSLPSLTSDGLLWYGEAPNQPITPYAVLIMVSEPETARTTALTESVLFEGTYQINCMHDTLQAAEAMAKTVWNTFNGAQLIRDGKPVMHCLAGEQRSMLGHELGINGKDCWISYVEIEVLYMR